MTENLIELTPTKKHFRTNVMYPLFVVLLLVLPSFEAYLEQTGDTNAVLLSGFNTHQKFLKELSDQIEIKVSNATQTALANSKQGVEILEYIEGMEYTFLQIFQSLTSGDASFTNELIEVYTASGEHLRLSDYFKSHIMLLSEPTYSALKSIVESNRHGLKPIPDEVIDGILSMANKSSVFDEAAKRGNVGVVKWLQHHVSEAQRLSALEAAWRRGDFDIIKMLIKGNATFVKAGMSFVRHRNSNEETLLHLAAELKNPRFVKSLIDCGAEVNVSDASGTTPLLRAVKNNDILTVKTLIEKKAGVNAATKLGYTALHEAARNGNHEMVTLLLASGSSLNKETEQGVTPLLISEKYALREIIDYLFWSNSITVKQLSDDFKFLYFMTLYEAPNRNTRRRKINLEQILEHSMIAKELLLRGEKTYIPNDIKSKVSDLVMKLGITTLTRSMFNIGARLDPERNETKRIFRNAIINGNHELIALMLNEGMSENTEFGGATALQLAADHGSVTIFNLLLNRGANVKKVRKVFGSMLHIASEGGKISIVRYLLDNGSKVDSLDRDGNSPLDYAAIYGFPDIVKLLLDYKANPNLKNKDKDTPLHFAAHSDDATSIKILYEGGAEIEARNKNGETPLFVAAKTGNGPTLTSLLNLGAAIDVKNNNDETPLEVSIESGHINTTRILLDNGMNPNFIDARSRTSLHLAASSGKEELVELILKKGTLINVPDNAGRNALHEAVSQNSLGIVNLLVNSGISINAKDEEGMTPLDYAIKSCSRDIVSFLVKKGGRASILADPKCIIGD